MATLAPLLDAAPLVQLHAGAALVSVVLGPFVLFRRSRDRWHRVGGYVWISAMAVVALSSFGIRTFAVVGPFGPIHLLSAYTLVMLALGLRAALQRRIEAHRRTMQGMYVWALGVAGLFTLLPGRVMHHVVFGADTALGFGLLVVSLALIWAGLRLRGRLGNTL